MIFNDLVKQYAAICTAIGYAKGLLQGEVDKKDSATNIDDKEAYLAEINRMEVRISNYEDDKHDIEFSIQSYIKENVSQPW